MLQSAPTRPPILDRHGTYVTGLIARPSVLEAFSREHSLPWPVALTGGGLAILPLREVDLAQFQTNPSDNTVDWPYLSERLLEELLRSSRQGPLMYFETEYFRGLGGQGAVVIKDGELIFGPRWARTDSINEGLKLLGVSVEPPARDEFETVGLHLHRTTAGWLKLQ